MRADCFRFWILGIDHVTAAQPIDLMSEQQPPGGADVSAAPAMVRRVADAMDRAAIPYTLQMLPRAMTAPEELAEACGCEVNFIVQALLMRGKATKKNFLILHSAATRVNDRILGPMVGENLQRADADFTLRFTGFPMGCVPPIGHQNRVPMLMDISLTRFARVWCPSGAPNALFSVPTLVLARAVSARIVQFN